MHEIFDKYPLNVFLLIVANIDNLLIIRRGQKGFATEGRGEGRKEYVPKLLIPRSTSSFPQIKSFLFNSNPLSPAQTKWNFFILEPETKFETKNKPECPRLYTYIGMFVLPTIFCCYRFMFISTTRCSGRPSFLREAILKKMSQSYGSWLVVLLLHLWSGQRDPKHLQQAGYVYEFCFRWIHLGSFLKAFISLVS